MLAELPQMVKQKIWRLRSFRKWQNKEFGACGASASTNINVFFVFMRSATDKRVSFGITVQDLSKIKKSGNTAVRHSFRFYHAMTYSTASGFMLV